MADGSGALAIRLAAGIDDIAPADWDRCAGAGNPTVSHAFLAALEHSGSVGADAGWTPCHLAAERGDGALIAVAPMYLKAHSYGEYVFDHGWADAFIRAGGRYYPKLQVAVPFTPAPGPRLLVRPDAPRETGAALAAGLIEVARRLGVSSAHVTFADAGDAATLEQAGFLMRSGYQFHWRNQGFASFDEFLATFASRKRKAVKKERRDAVADGVVIHTLTGAAIEERHWSAFYRFYMATSDRKWGQAYLTRSFFHEIGRVMADRIVLVMAEHKGGFVAGALNLLGRDTLYGRNWGVIGDYPCLHFEVCYYRAIDFAIERGLAFVEAGAQGEHKLQRGYIPTRTHSAHWIADRGFRRAVAEFLQRETGFVTAEIAELAAHSPFRKGDET